jgi:hypothetical protein
MSWHQIQLDGESNGLTLSDESVQFKSDELEVRDRSPLILFLTREFRHIIAQLK